MIFGLSTIHLLFNFFSILTVANPNGKRQTGDVPSTNKKLNTGHARVRTSDGDTVVAEKKNPELLEPHTFAPQDLLALLRNLENEICVCEITLKDENDKQNKYKVRFADAIEHSLTSIFLGRRLQTHAQLRRIHLHVPVDAGRARKTRGPRRAAPARPEKTGHHSGTQNKQDVEEAR